MVADTGDRIVSTAAADMSLAVIINLNSRRGRQDAPDLVRRLLPEARLLVSSTLEELETFVTGELRNNPPSLLLAGGGDGTITGLINTLLRHRIPLPPLGILPLGTGNAWARVAQVPKNVERALKRLAKIDLSRLPTQPFNLVRVEGQVGPFAGTGWDADLLQDFKAQLEGWPEGPIRDAHRGFRGYVTALYTRTVSRHVFGGGPPRVKLINLGQDVQSVDAKGRRVVLSDYGHGSVLYDGVLGVAGAATIEEYGFGLRAYPFARLIPDRLNVRVYGAKIMRGVVNSVRLWRGVHPLPHMHDFFVTKARMEFDRPLPVQVAGDVLGARTSVEFELDDQHVQFLDWSRIPS